MDICNFCLQPGRVVPTRVPLQYSCGKCLPYANGLTNSLMYSVAELGRDASQIQSNDGPLTCKYCNKTFEKNIQYQNHLRNHSAERKFICPHCSKGFSQSNNLRAHLRIHTNERPFKCPECGKAFTQITNLNNHIRLHTGEKPYACKEPGCNRAFAQVTNLNNHKKSHMRDFKTFKCTYCNKTFAQRNHLVSHVQSEHEAQNEWSFKSVCNACGESFSSAMALMVHNKSECRERFGQAEKRKLDDTMNQSSNKRDVVKCLFGDCQMYFENMDQMQMHLSSKHGLSINSNKSKEAMDFSNEVIEIDDDETPSRSSTHANQPHYNRQQNEKNNGRTRNVDIKKDESSSSSDSESDSSDDGDSDNRESERRKHSQMKMVCNICFSMFDNSPLLEKHMKKSH